MHKVIWDCISLALIKIRQSKCQFQSVCKVHSGVLFKRGEYTWRGISRPHLHCLRRIKFKVNNARLSGRRAAEIGGNYRDPDSGPLDKTERIKLTQWWGDLFCFGFWFWEQSFFLQVWHFDQQCNNALIQKGIFVLNPLIDYSQHAGLSRIVIYCIIFFFQVNLNYNESRFFDCLSRWHFQKINLMQIKLACILTKTLTAQNEKQFKFFCNRGPLDMYRLCFCFEARTLAESIRGIISIANQFVRV